MTAHVRKGVVKTYVLVYGQEYKSTRASLANVAHIAANRRLHDEVVVTRGEKGEEIRTLHPRVEVTSTLVDGSTKTRNMRAASLTSYDLPTLLKNKPIKPKQAPAVVASIFDGEQAHAVLERILEKLNALDSLISEVRQIRGVIGKASAVKAGEADTRKNGDGVTHLWPAPNSSDD